MTGRADAGTQAQIAESIAARRAAARSPSDDVVQQQLGLALARASGYGAAVRPLRRATWLVGHSPDHHINLGILLIDLKRPQEAGAAFRRALALVPGDPDVLHGAGVADSELGRFDEGERRLRRSLRVGPLRAETAAKLAAALLRLRRIDEAEAMARRVLALAPGMATAHVDLSAILARQDRFATALRSCHRACAIDRRPARALTNAGGILAILGRTADALAALRQAADLDGAEPFRNMLAVVCYMPFAPAARWKMAAEFERRYAPPRRPPDFARPLEDRRTLTVGYLSSDFFEHPVGRNMVPIIEAHDRERFRVICYSDAEVNDALTHRFRGAAALWRKTSGLDDSAVARMVHSDAVDVLVILGGRFDRNRPLVAAHRAAPVQISAHDCATSGLADMDYLIADRVLVPPASRRSERFSERVIRLPSFYVHEPIPMTAEPARARGELITFACFNNPQKLSAETLQLWSRLLHRLPDARLRLKFQTRYRSEDLRLRILSALGADPDRLEFLWGEEPIAGHLAYYYDVDIALDTFPFTGCTTTFEALWMGVPVVSLKGDTMVSSLSASFLKPAGLGDLIASTPDDYLAIAEKLARDPARRTALRLGLRSRLLASPICDGRARARQLERVYRAVWRRWCRAQASS
jgi:predicted O-linked N-acetylglucosamine transferase (SPINDLY family)